MMAGHVLQTDEIRENCSGYEIRDILREKHPQAAGIVNEVIVNSPYQTGLPFYTECFEEQKELFMKHDVQQVQLDNLKLTHFSGDHCLQNLVEIPDS
ncbi:hypothetical protein GJ496_007760 [Pomphorhynchus laevis]|nr:hypothetical protein GJ496_006743 [Pomphorhynchus laevis]KAI0982304.1 hypothetical protein GJ496_006744 [Pomphorhynchus laevis]KAI0990106.1 hypothetical protein GJ496_007760 [Pomphorhynchus laevis]